MLYLFTSVLVYHDQHHKCDHQVFLIFEGLFPIVGCAFVPCALSHCALVPKNIYHEVFQLGLLVMVQNFPMRSGS
jgi:hypothetical protein